MPVISVWAIRISLLYLCAGFGIGALLLWNHGVPLDPRMWMLLPAHIEFLLFGWIVQLAMGVGYWILPRHQKRPKRGKPSFAIASLGLLNLGIVIVGTAPFTPGSSGVFLLGRLIELSGVSFFLLVAWPRIRPGGEG